MTDQDRYIDMKKYLYILQSNTSKGRVSMFSSLFKKTAEPLEYELMLKKGMLKFIMKAKGWKTYQDVGIALGYTRQYISMLDNRKVSATADFMLSLAAAIGSIDEGWHTPFEIVPKGTINPNSPRFNYDKFNQVKPYIPNSSAGSLRYGDQVEHQKNNLT